jgi:hypothetical protein
MRIAVLPDHILLVVPAEGPGLSDRACSEMGRYLKEALPDWRPIIFREGGEIVDMRGDAEATAAANLLLSHLEALA